MALFGTCAVGDGTYVVTLPINLYGNSYIVVLGTCQSLLTWKALFLLQEHSWMAWGIVAKARFFFTMK